MYEDTATPLHVRETEKRIEYLIDRLEHSSNLGGVSSKVSLSADDKRTIIDGIISASKVEIRDEVLDEILRSRSSEESSALQKKSLQRLSAQLSSLGSRANSNLFLGIIAASVGLASLYFTLVNVVPSGANVSWLDFARQYIPRLSLVLIIEFVAFFFLRLYSKTLVELRYTQNEITNIELKLISLHEADSAGDVRTKRDVLLELSRTERNHILDKSQTTVEIEKDRVNQDAQNAVLGTISEILHGKSANSMWSRRTKP